MCRCLCLLRLAVPLVLCAVGARAFAQSTAFTYQGRLSAGDSPANGTYDLAFALFDEASTGTQQGAWLTNSAVVVSNGLFTTTLDFGAQPWNGQPLWLQVLVRASGNGAFTPLNPRQPVTPTPYAISAGNLVGPVSVAGLSGAYTNVLILNNPANRVNGTFTGEGLGLTNTLWSGLRGKGTVTVSAKGIANGLSALKNDGADFGPDTPGTTTYGIQEAINSLPISSNRVSPGGGVVQLGPGVFYTTSTIHTINNTNPFALTIRGSGAEAGGIVYVGSVPQTVIKAGIPHSINSVSFNLENLWIASAINAPTNIVYLAGNGEDDFVTFGGVDWAGIRDCWFGFWPSMTNNPPFGLVTARYNDALVHNLVGLDVDCNWNQIIQVEHCQFTAVMGIGWHTDHGYVRACQFANSGITTSVPTNAWPASSPFSMGAAITCYGRNGNEVWNFSDNVFINCALCYFAGNGFRTLRRVSYNDHVEVGRDFVATAGDSWLAVNPDTVAGQPGVFSSNWLVTNLVNFANWRTQPDTTNAVRVVDLLKGQFTGMVLSGNGSGLTNTITTVSGDYMLGARNATILFNGPGTNMITLPSVSSAPGVVYCLKNINTGAFILTNANGAQAIDGALSLTNNTRYQTIRVQSDGSNWWLQ